MPLLSHAAPAAPRHAMLLAAGLGARMRPLTAHTAKPLLQLDGRPLLDHALDRLEAAGVARVVVNAHWQADRVAAHLAAHPRAARLAVRREESLLDTGGAVAAARADGLLGDGPFFVVNGDNYWLDGPAPTLDRMADAFRRTGADAVLLMHRTCAVHAETGRGDFVIDGWGVPRRPAEGEIAPFLYAGLQLLAPALFRDPPGPRFSMNLLWDRAIAAGRLRALVHDGLWFHVSRPDDLAEAEHALLEQRTGETR